MASPISQTLQTMQAMGTSHNVFLQDKIIRSERKNRKVPQPYDKLMTVAEMIQKQEANSSLLFQPGPNSADLYRKTKVSGVPIPEPLSATVYHPKTHLRADSKKKQLLNSVIQELDELDSKQKLRKKPGA